MNTSEQANESRVGSIIKAPSGYANSKQKTKGIISTSQISKQSSATTANNNEYSGQFVQKQFPQEKHIKMINPIEFQKKIKNVDIMTHNKVFPKFYVLDSIPYRSQYSLSMNEQQHNKPEKVIEQKQPVSPERWMVFNLLKQQAYKEKSQFVPPVDFTNLIESTYTKSEGQYSYQILSEDQNKNSNNDSQARVASKDHKNNQHISKEEITNSYSFLAKNRKLSTTISRKSHSPEKHKNSYVSTSNVSAAQSRGSTRDPSLTARLPTSSDSQISPIPQKKTEIFANKKIIQQLNENMNKKRQLRSVTSLLSNGDCLTKQPQKISTSGSTADLMASNEEKLNLKQNQLDSIKIIQQIAKPTSQKYHRNLRSNTEPTQDADCSQTTENGMSTYFKQLSIQRGAQAETENSISQLLSNFQDPQTIFPEDERSIYSHTNHKNTHLIRQTKEESVESQQAKRMDQAGYKLSLENSLLLAKKAAGLLADFIHQNKARDITRREMHHLSSNLPLVTKFLFRNGVLRRDIDYKEILEWMKSQRNESSRRVSTLLAENSLIQEQKSKEKQQYDWQRYLELLAFNTRMNALLEKQNSKVFFQLERDLSWKKEQQNKQTSIAEKFKIIEESQIRKSKMLSYEHLQDWVDTADRKLGGIDIVSSLTRQNYCKLTDLMRKYQQ